MRVIGVRAEKDVIHWAVVEGTPEDPVLVAHDKIKSPKGYGEVEALGLFRTQVKTLLHQYKPNRVAVRQSETFLKGKPGPTAFGSMLQRARVEGVVMELAHSQGLEVQPGALAQIGSGLGSKNAKSYLVADDLRGLDWSKIKNASDREAILCAASLLKE